MCRNLVCLFLWVATMGFALGGSYGWGLKPCAMYYVHHASKNQTGYNPCPSFLEWIVSFVNPASIAAFGAFAAAVFTLLLWDSTYKLWTSSERQIDLVRKGFVSTHRPRIVVRDFKIIKNGDGNPLVVRYKITNVGETTATIRIYWAQILLGDKELIGPPPRPKRKNISIWRGEALSRGGRIFEEARTNSNLSETESFDILSGDTGFHVFGWVQYADELGKVIETGFARHYTRGRFVKVANEEYEYAD